MRARRAAKQTRPRPLLPRGWLGGVQRGDIPAQHVHHHHRLIGLHVPHMYSLGVRTQAVDEEPLMYLFDGRPNFEHVCVQICPCERCVEIRA